mmetsp:Transcript_48105/g.53867  ORF Transcript_48105/g.53867 Transcript_48105/m.53867 type:complete len:141 (+) Transcript_48105:113-535(+)
MQKHVTSQIYYEKHYIWDVFRIIIGIAKQQQQQQQHDRIECQGGRSSKFVQYHKYNNNCNTARHVGQRGGQEDRPASNLASLLRHYRGRAHREGPSGSPRSTLQASSRMDGAVCPEIFDQIVRRRLPDDIRKRNDQFARH